jgi:pseudouridine-5'-phosphate glycosidase
MRPELPTAVAVDNSASIQPARSIFISWGKSVQISGATSESLQTFGLPVVGHGEKNRLWITFWRKFSSMKSTLNHQNHGKAMFS